MFNSFALPARARRISFHLLGLFSLLTLTGADQVRELPFSLPMMPLPTPVAISPLPVEPARPQVRFELPHIAWRKLPVEQRYRYYASIVESAGGQVKPDKVTVLGLRGISPCSRRHNSGENAGPYDDTFIVLKRTVTGRAQVTELLGSTHAGQETSSWSPNGVAQIRPGHFRAIPQGDHEGMPCWLVLNRRGEGTIPCWRDVNADGRISDKEQVEGKVADGILFHNGRFSDHGSSIGCQTMPPAVHQRFIDLVGQSSSFDYTLVDANEPLPVPSAT